MMLAAATDNTDVFTLLFCELFGNSIKIDVPTDTLFDSVNPDGTLKGSVFELSKSLGGCRFLGLASVVILMLGPVDRGVALRAILKEGPSNSTA